MILFLIILLVINHILVVAEISIDNDIHIGLSSDENQLEGMIACIKSILIHSSDKSRLKFHILSNIPMSKKIKESIACIKIDIIGNAEILIKVLKNDEINSYKLLKNMDNDNFSERVRVYLPLIFPHVNKILWADCDTLFLADIIPMIDNLFIKSNGQLANSSSDDITAYKSIAAVPRPDRSIFHMTGIKIKVLNKYGFKQNEKEILTYGVFNSGVYVINCLFWRNHNLVEEFELLNAYLFANNFKGINRATRQDTQSPLNLLTIKYNGFIQLDPGWNVDGFGWNKAIKCSLNSIYSNNPNNNNKIKNAKALHWTGRHKPWLKKGMCIELWLNKSGGINKECTISV